MNSKYEMIYKDYQESGLKLKEYCLLNNLNYHNTQSGIYHYKRNIKDKANNNIQVIKVKDEVNKDNKFNFKINDINCSLSYSDENELISLIRIIKNV